MSSIDKYKHKHLGFIECPSKFNFVHNNATRKIAIYELLENIPLEEEDFDGKAGDLIVGGGSGEAAAFRISIPEAILFSFHDWYDFNNYEELFRAFWNPTTSYIFGEGFSKIGWDPSFELEMWLANNICAILIDKFEQYKVYKRPKWSAKTDLTFFKNA